MNGIIDPCGYDGVNSATMQYVKDEINRAVFEAGTCTPDSVQAQIDANAEVIKVNDASVDKLLDAYENPSKYVYYYEADGNTYAGRAVMEFDESRLLWIYFDKVVTGGTIVSHAPMIDDEVLAGTINEDGVFAYRRRYYKPYEYDISDYYDQTRLKEIYDRVNFLHYSNNCSVSWIDSEHGNFPFHGRFIEHKEDYAYFKGYGNGTDGKLYTETLKIDAEGNVYLSDFQEVASYKQIDLATATVDELIDLVANPTKYEVRYTYGNKQYLPRAIKENTNTSGERMIEYEFLVTDDNYSLMYIGVEPYRDQNIYDKVVLLRVHGSKGLLTPRIRWEKGVSYNWSKMDDTQKERLLKRIYEGFQEIHQTHGNTMWGLYTAADFTLRWNEFWDFGDYTTEGQPSHELYPEGKMLQYYGDIPYISGIIITGGMLRVSTLWFNVDDDNKTAVINRQEIKKVNL